VNSVKPSAKVANPLVINFDDPVGIPLNLKIAFLILRYYKLCKKVLDNVKNQMSSTKISDNVFNTPSFLFQQTQRAFSSCPIPSDFWAFAIDLLDPTHSVSSNTTIFLFLSYPKRFLGICNTFRICIATKSMLDMRIR
jgi:hypothetical protein